MHIPYRLKRRWLILSGPFRKTYTANICRHETYRRGLVEKDGHEYMTRTPLGKNGTPDYCLECISKMSTVCEGCTEPVHIGQWVMERGGHIVACLRCMEFPTDADACWVPPGRAARGAIPFGVFEEDAPPEMKDCTGDVACYKPILK